MTWCDIKWKKLFTFERLLLLYKHYFYGWVLAQMDWQLTMNKMTVQTQKKLGVHITEIPSWINFWKTAFFKNQNGSLLLKTSHHLAAQYLGFESNFRFFMPNFWYQGQYLGAKRPAKSCKRVTLAPGFQEALWASWWKAYKVLELAKIPKFDSNNHFKFKCFNSCIFVKNIITLATNHSSGVMDNLNFPQ